MNSDLLILNQSNMAQKQQKKKKKHTQSNNQTYSPLWQLTEQLLPFPAHLPSMASQLPYYEMQFHLGAAAAKCGLLGHG